MFAGIVSGVAGRGLHSYPKRADVVAGFRISPALRLLILLIYILIEEDRD